MQALSHCKMTIRRTANVQLNFSVDRARGKAIGSSHRTPMTIRTRRKVTAAETENPSRAFCRAYFEMWDRLEEQGKLARCQRPLDLLCESHETYTTSCISEIY